MRDEALERFARQADALLSRRTTVLSVGLGMLVALGTKLDEALAKNKKKRRRRKRRRRQRRRRKNAPQTCAEQCAAEFVACFARAADSTLCGDTAESLCTPCTSDQDCVGDEFPYCLEVNGVTDRATEESSEILTNACGLFLDAVCGNLLPLP